MKRILSLLLALIFTVIPLQMSNDAFAGESLSLPVEIQNPFYDGREVYFTSLDTAEDEAPVDYDGVSYYPDGAYLEELIRERLSNRETSFTLCYLSPSRLVTTAQLSSRLDKMLVGATEEKTAKTTTDGDYLRWAVKSFGALKATLDSAAGGNYYYTLTMTADYYSSAAQEKETNKAIYYFISSLNTDHMSDYQIVRKVHDYICSKAVYDDAAAKAPDKNPSAFTAYGALIEGKACCQGYSAAFYRICKELGYNVRVVSSDISSGNHSWNIVELASKYYCVDCTWDDLIIDNKKSQSRYAYFLVNETTLQKDDSSLREHLADEKYYATQYFVTNYQNKLAETNYNQNDKNLLSNCVISLSYHKYRYIGAGIHPFVKVKEQKGQLLKNGVDYRISYTRNVNIGYAKAVVTGKGRFSGQTSHRRFTIIPSKTGTLHVSDITKTTAVVQWNRLPGGVTGYALEHWKGDRWVVIKYVPAAVTSLKVTGLTGNSVQYFRVRAYTFAGEINLYGAYSPTLSFRTAIG